MTQTVVFDPQAFLEREGTKRIKFHEGEVIFSQGDEADAVFYIEDGSVNLSHRGNSGETRVIDILQAGEFFGVGCVAGQSQRRLGATASSTCSTIRIENSVIVKALYENFNLADLFITFLIDRNRHYCDGLLDHLSSASEKRLMRTLLLLCDLGDNDGMLITLPNVSQEALAEMAGTTKLCIEFFIQKFHKLGWIEYNGRIRLSISKLRSALYSYQENN